LFFFSFDAQYVMLPKYNQHLALALLLRTTEAEMQVS